MSRVFSDNISRYRSVQGNRGQEGGFVRSQSPRLPDGQTPRVEVSDVDKSPLLMHAEFKDNILLRPSSLSSYQRSSTPMGDNLDTDRMYSPMRSIAKDVYHTPQSLRSNSPRPRTPVSGHQDLRDNPRHKSTVFRDEQKSFLAQCWVLVSGFVHRILFLQLLADTFILYRFSNTKKKVFRVVLLLCFIPLVGTLLYKYGIPGSGLFYGSRMIASVQTPTPHTHVSATKVVSPTEQWNVQLQKEMEHKYHELIERKWTEHLERMDKKWAEFSHNMRILEMLVLQEVNNTKALVKQVAELKMKSESRINMEASGAKEKVDQLTQKCSRLEELVNSSINCCQAQALTRADDLKHQLSALSQELRQNLSQLAPLQVTSGSATRGEIEELIKTVVDRYDADKIGIPDFALESAGGSILTSRCSETYPHGTSQFTLFGVPVWKARNSPRAAIQPQTHPGECWAMHGTDGTLAVLLSTPIVPTAFSLEHITKKMAPSGIIDSAPKDFSVYGLESENDEEGHRFGTYTYRDDGRPLQTFNVTHSVDRAFSIVELHVESNYGNPEYTCIYRFRVHGTPV